MTGHDPELDQLRGSVSCATLLERFTWRLDKRESTHNCLKFRRGNGEIVLVTHGGKGWWDPCSTAKGDIFALVQHLEPTMNFGEVRKLLRPLAGISPSFHELPYLARSGRGPVSYIGKWERRPQPCPGSPAWRYLGEERALPGSVLQAANRQGALRERPYGSAWFGHCDHEGRLTGYEMRGPTFRGFSPGGSKTLFRLSGNRTDTLASARRLIVAEAPIDAMSIAAVERLRADSLYVATGGGMGPRTIEALEHELRALLKIRHGEFGIATDNDTAGDAYAERLAIMAHRIGVPSRRLLPNDGAKDWNDGLKLGGIA